MSEVKRYDVSVFGGMSMDESSDGAYVNYDDYAALEAKCAALAAENAALKQSEKEFNNFCRHEYYGWEDNFTETPVTDDFLDEVRAQGVDMARNAMIDFVDGEVGPNKNVPGLIRGAEICVSIAEQLRKGGDQK